jgi:predicted choloylglycine hydrolase
MRIILECCDQIIEAGGVLPIVNLLLSQENIVRDSVNAAIANLSVYPVLYVVL